MEENDENDGDRHADPSENDSSRSYRATALAALVRVADRCTTENDSQDTADKRDHCDTQDA